MELITALERATVAQMLEKEVFFHSALGINAGLPRFTWKCTQVMKVGRGDGGDAEDDDAFCGADAGGVCAEDTVLGYMG